MRYLPIALLIAISTVGCDEGLKSKSDGVSGSRTNVPSTPSGQDDSTANTRERNGTAKTPLDRLLSIFNEKKFCRIDVCLQVFIE